MSADITMRTAEELGRLIAGGGVTARQVVEALLELLSQLERGESFQETFRTLLHLAQPGVIPSADGIPYAIPSLVDVLSEPQEDGAFVQAALESLTADG